MARKMKDSGIEWIGEIPEGWSKNKVIRLFDIIGSGTTPKNITSDFPVVNWIQSGDITGSFMPTCKNVISANLLSQYSALKVYPAPFIIIAMYGASVGNASISLIDGCVNQACCVLSSPSCNLHYAFYVIKSAQSYLVRKAVGGGQPNISQETIKQLWLPLPPLSTQDIIVRNLDATCSKIDDLLSSVHASIEEYKKLKQAVITLAVTKGVRGEREMKDSGVEWIGKVPSKWNCIKIKYLFEIRKRIAGKEGYTVLSITQTGIKPKNISSNEGQLADSYSNYQLLHFGEFAMNHMDLLTGWVDISNYNGVTSPDYRVFSLKDTITNHPRYFLYLMQMCYFNRIFYSMAQGVSSLGRWRLQSDKFLNCIFPVPSIEEQKEISAYLDTTCSEIDKLIAKKEQLVKELESYKKSLIYEVVTGKREV